jgi:hypothetical protein
MRRTNEHLIIASDSSSSYSDSTIHEPTLIFLVYFKGGNARVTAIELPPSRDMTQKNPIIEKLINQFRPGAWPGHPADTCTLATHSVYAPLTIQFLPI